MRRGEAALLQRGPMWLPVWVMENEFNADQHVPVVSSGCEVWRPYEGSLRPILSEDRDLVLSQLPSFVEAAAHYDAWRERDREEVTSLVRRDERGVETEVVREIECEKGATERGKLEVYDPPMRLVVGMTGNLNGDMVTYLDRRFPKGKGDNSSYENALRTLLARNPAQFEVFIAHWEDGRSLRDVAQSQGISYEAAKKRWRRADGFIRERIQILEDIHIA